MSGSFRKERIGALIPTELGNQSIEDLKQLSKELLESGIHGICFSAYEEGQEPGDTLTEAQVRRRLEILKPYIKWVRTFSCIEGNELIAKIAKELGIKTLVGAWLGKDHAKNRQEIEALIAMANEGFVDIAAVGNEVMYRDDLTEDELLVFLDEVKAAVSIPVGYVDAYYEFEHRPRITERCDVILSNCYPFWEGCDIDYSLMYMQEMFRIAQQAGNGKKVIITETGWPEKGSNLEGAFPSFNNFLKYFINTQRWSKQDDIEIFYFSSFDEAWKVGDEGDVGAYWGLWDKHEKLKFL
jgi:exo-beta-1,3-glucanase (GH17 family)